jgi:four helix bundle protein
MKDTSFENLRVYKLAEKLANEVWAVVIRWDVYARSAVGLQLVGAADSVGANLAEGTGRGSHQSTRRFVTTARASLYEVCHWLRRVHKRKLLSQEQVRRIKPLMDDLSPMLNAYRRSIASVPSIKAVASDGTPEPGARGKGTMADDRGPVTKD